MLHPGTDTDRGSAPLAAFAVAFIFAMGLLAGWISGAAHANRDAMTRARAEATNDLHRQVDELGPKVERLEAELLATLWLCAADLTAIERPPWVMVDLGGGAYELRLTLYPRMAR